MTVNAGGGLEDTPPRGYGVAGVRGLTLLLDPAIELVAGQKPVRFTVSLARPWLARGRRNREPEPVGVPRGERSLAGVTGPVAESAAEVESGRIVLSPV
jgi:hypothetical protein